MISSVDILSQRVGLLERTYVGKSAVGAGDREADILQRIEAIHSRFKEIEVEIPTFKACYEAVLKLRSMLLEKKGAAVLISQKIEGLLANRESLQSSAKTLLKIDELSSVIDNDSFKGILFILWRITLEWFHAFVSVEHDRCIDTRNVRASAYSGACHISIKT